MLGQSVCTHNKTVDITLPRYNNMNLNNVVINWIGGTCGLLSTYLNTYYLSLSLIYLH